MPSENPDILSRLGLGEKFSQVQFGPGVVGKTSRATMALIAIWGIIAFRLSSDLSQNIALIVAGCIPTGAYFWWVKASQAFAKANPDLALLEGAQFVEYQKWQSEIQGRVIDNAMPVIEPKVPRGVRKIKGDAS